jgi:hypothetical protein
LLWAWLCHLSLRDVKAYLTDVARRELRTENIAVCCAKLAFLPAVIVWQSFVEVLPGWGAALAAGTTHAKACPAAAATCPAAPRPANNPCWAGSGELRAPLLSYVCAC